MYPRAILLEHNGAENGTILCTFEQYTYDTPVFSIYASEDNGLTWQLRSKVEDTQKGWGCRGIIAVNTATFVGHKRKGIPGGIVATLGVVFPSLIIIIILAGLITTFADLPIVQNAFAGIRVCVCVLIFNAVVKLWKGAVKSLLALGIFLAVALAASFLSISPAVYVLIAAALGVVLEALHVMPGERGKKA